MNESYLPTIARDRAADSNSAPPDKLLFGSWVQYLEYLQHLQQSGTEMEVSSLLTQQQTSSHSSNPQVDTQ